MIADTLPDTIDPTTKSLAITLTSVILGVLEPYLNETLRVLKNVEGASQKSYGGVGDVGDSSEIASIVSGNSGRSRVTGISSIGGGGASSRSVGVSELQKLHVKPGMEGGFEFGGAHRCESCGSYTLAKPGSLLANLAEKIDRERSEKIYDGREGLTAADRSLNEAELTRIGSIKSGGGSAIGGSGSIVSGGGSIELDADGLSVDGLSTSGGSANPKRSTCINCEGLGFAHYSKKKHSGSKNLQCKGCKTCHPIGFFHPESPSCAKSGIRCSGCLACPDCKGDRVVKRTLSRSFSRSRSNTASAHTSEHHLSILQQNAITGNLVSGGSPLVATVQAGVDAESSSSPTTTNGLTVESQLGDLITPSTPNPTPAGATTPNTANNNAATTTGGKIARLFRPRSQSQSASANNSRPQSPYFPRREQSQQQQQQEQILGSVDIPQTTLAPNITSQESKPRAVDDIDLVKPVGVKLAWSGSNRDNANGDGGSGSIGTLPTDSTERIQVSKQAGLANDVEGAREVSAEQ
ncbi:hypothetical protein HDU76_006309 [Blyttiomyces sp. JEL0837]|nr:hypothetical protein HDU76_006309 [Blyttiomyces sp. JEL0837]